MRKNLSQFFGFILLLLAISVFLTPLLPTQKTSGQGAQPRCFYFSDGNQTTIAELDACPPPGEVIYDNGQGVQPAFLQPGTCYLLVPNLFNADPGIELDPYIQVDCTTRTFCPAGQEPRYSVDSTGGPPACVNITEPVSGEFADQVDTDEENNEGCNRDGGDFSFILCPILIYANEGVEILDGKINNNLQVKDRYYNDESVRNAWGRFRNIAYILLIPVVLLMVIGTALGFNFVDAYTVKRAMPRLLVAAIFMALSYSISIIMIEATNVIGRGVAGLVAAPFGGTDALRLQNIFSPGLGAPIVGDAVGGSVGVLGGVGIFIAGGLSLGIVASYMGSFVLVLIIAFALLTVREFLIIMLVILSPLAIISWIFPGNDKLWKLWWGTFTKLLMLYPLIMMLLMSGRGFALITSRIDSAGTLDSVFLVLIKLTAYFGPFFFVPAAFKFAGGAFANLAGIVNDRGKGLFDRNRKYRADARKNNRERIKGDRAFKGGNPDNLRGKLNTKFARAYGHIDAAKEGGILRYATGGKADRARGVDAMAARSVKQHRDHILEDKDVAEWLGYDDLTGLSSAVASGDDETIEKVIRAKYRYVGDSGAIDEDGNYNEAAEAEIQSLMASIKERRSKGDMRGAMKLVFEAANHKNNVREQYVREEGGSWVKDANGNWQEVEAGEGTHTKIKGEQAFNGDQRFLDTSLVQVTNAYRKYGHEALTQAMTLKALAGGTFYRNAGDTWDAVLASVTHDGHVDRNSLADMAVKGRQMLLATGRPEGAASFGATLGALSDLEKGKIELKNSNGREATVTVGGSRIRVNNEKELRDAVNKSLMNTVYEQKGAAIFTHPDMKTGYIRDNVVPVIQERIERAKQKAINSGEFEKIINADGSETIQINGESYKAEIAAAENLLRSLSNSKPEAAKLFASQIFSYSVKDGEKGRVLTASEQSAQHKAQIEYDKQRQEYEIKVSLFKEAEQKRNEILDAIKAGRTMLPNGQPLPQILFDPNGNPLNLPPLPDDPGDPPKRPQFIETIRSEIGRLQNDPVYQNYGYQFYQAEQSWRQEVQNARSLILQQQEFARQQAALAGMPVTGGGVGPPPPGTGGLPPKLGP